MDASKWISRGMVIVLIAAMMPLMAAAMPAADAEKPGNVEDVLWAAVAAGETSELVVEFTEQADLSAAYGMDWDARGEYVVDTLSAVAEKVQAGAIAYVEGLGLEHETFIAGNELYVWGGGQDAVVGLASLPKVAFVRVPAIYYLDPPTVSEAPVPDAIKTWGIIDTNADDFWSTFSVQGDGIVVANIDTGADYTHDALEPNYKCGVSGPHEDCWEDPGVQNCYGPGGGPCDTWAPIYHGTHTMGTMVADDDPSLSYTAGMAPNAEWISCLGCPNGGCPDYDLNTCADWMLAPGGSSANRPHVVNNSWGGGGGDPWYKGKVNAWRAAGIFPAFSAGNSYSCNSLGSPGDYQESFGSASHRSDRNISGFSSKGPSVYGHTPYTKPNISAPGEDVISCKPGDTWQYMDGTSMASPHSAGAVALLWSCNPSLVGQVDQTFQILQDAADASPAGGCGAPPDGEGNYTYGYGYLNILAAGNDWCGPTDTMHVNYIHPHHAVYGAWNLLAAAVRIYDQDDLPVGGATVNVEWTLPNNSTRNKSGVTYGSGWAAWMYIFSLQTGTYEVCVTDVTKAGYTYAPDENVMTCNTVYVP